MNPEKPHFHPQEKIPEMEKPVDVLLVRPSVDSLIPNPAGIESLLESTEGQAEYLDLNEELFLHWALNSETIKGIVERQKEKPSSQFWDNLNKWSINEERLNEITENVERARQFFTTVTSIKEGEAVSETNLLEDFKTYCHNLDIITDAFKVISSPYYFSEKEFEELRFARNTIDYYNSHYKETRESLIDLVGRESIFKQFIEEHKINGHSVIEKVLSGKPKLIGLSVTHPDQLLFSFQLAKSIKEHSPETTILLGGATVSLEIEEWIKDDELNRQILDDIKAARDQKTQRGFIDGIIISEGEIAAKELSTKIVNGIIDRAELFKDIPGIVYNEEGKIVFNNLPLPFQPKEQQIKHDVSGLLKRGIVPEEQKVISLRDSRLCFYKCQTGGCTFCAIGHHGLDILKPFIEQERIQIPNSEKPEKDLEKQQVIKVRRLGPEAVVEKVEKALERGFRIIDITDEEYPMIWTLQLCKLIKERELDKQGVIFQIQARGDESNYRQLINFAQSNPELSLMGGSEEETLSKVAKYLYGGGLRFVQMGLESAYPSVIKETEKGSSIEIYSKLLKAFSQADIMVHNFLMVGNPMKKEFWEKEKFQEESILNQRPTAEQLEILQFISTLKFLFHHRDFFTTMSSTKFKLARLSEAAKNPEAFGLKVKPGRKLSPNIPFEYREGYDPSNVLDKLLDLYDIWKKQELPVQPVASRYYYVQRLVVGKDRIDLLSRYFPTGESNRKLAGVLTERDIAKRDEILRLLWSKLVGEKLQRKYLHLEKDIRRRFKEQGLSDEQTKVATIDELKRIASREGNPILTNFPIGFRSFEDLYKVASLLDEVMNNNNRNRARQ